MFFFCFSHVDCGAGRLSCGRPAGENVALEAIGESKAAADMRVRATEADSIQLEVRAAVLVVVLDLVVMILVMAVLALVVFLLHAAVVAIILHTHIQYYLHLLRSPPTIKATYTSVYTLLHAARISVCLHLLSSLSVFLTGYVCNMYVCLSVVVMMLVAVLYLLLLCSQQQ